MCLIFFYRSVIFLQAALGAEAVPQPLINLEASFNQMGDMAFKKILNPSFTPYVVCDNLTYVTI